MHCHNAWDGWRKATRPKGRPVPDEWLWVYPMPDLLGFSLAQSESTLVETVAESTPAARAGVEVGDKLKTLDGQPLISCADVQWVLHHAPATGTLHLEVERKGETKKLSLTLPTGWRRKGDIDWRPSVGSLRPGARFASVTDDERTALGKGKPIVGLKATQVGPNREAGKAGMKVGDVLLALDGETAPLTPSEFIAWLYQEKRQGQKIDLLIDRSGTRQHLTMDAP